MTIAADLGEQGLEPPRQMTESANQVEGELAQLRAARAEAERYQRQTGTKARSEAQRKFTDTARICSLSFSLQDKYDENSVSEEKEIGV